MTRHGNWASILPGLPVLEIRDMQLRRIVARHVLESRKPPQFLYTSGRPGRYNPRDALCLYVSEDAATAGAEFDRYWDGRGLCNKRSISVEPLFQC